MSTFFSKRLVTIFSILIVTALALASCAPAQPAQPPSGPPTGTGSSSGGSAPSSSNPTSVPATSVPSSSEVKNPDTLIEATIGGPESLDPAWAYDTASGEVIFNVYETLLFPKKDTTTDFVPMLATSWDVSPDGLTYTFHIRQGIKFQDGQDLTPQDVAYSLWRVLTIDRAGGPSWILLQPFFGLDVQSFENDVVKKQFNGDWAKAAQAVEDAITFDNSAGTVTMKLKQPYGPFLQILTGSWASVVSMPWAIKQGAWDGKPEDVQKFNNPSAEADPLFKVMNGTGPYKLENWVPEQETDLARNDNYWVTSPFWDGGPTGPAKMQHVDLELTAADQLSGIGRKIVRRFRHRAAQTREQRRVAVPSIDLQREGGQGRRGPRTILERLKLIDAVELLLRYRRWRDADGRTGDLV